MRWYRMRALMTLHLYNIHVCTPPKRKATMHGNVVLFSTKKKSHNFEQKKQVIHMHPLFGGCLHLTCRDRHGTEPPSDLCEGWALCWIRGPALLHEPSPLRVTWGWHMRPQCVVYDAPCNMSFKSPISHNNGRGEKIGKCMVLEQNRIHTRIIKD